MMKQRNLFFFMLASAISLVTLSGASGRTEPATETGTAGESAQVVLKNSGKNRLYGSGVTRTYETNEPDNDRFWSASRISPSSSYTYDAPSSYSSTVESTLYKSGDVDFLFFQTLGRANIEIELSGERCWSSYGFELYRRLDFTDYDGTITYSVTYHPEYGDIEKIQTASLDSSSEREYIRIYGLALGAYYIKVYSKDGSYGTSDTYRVDLSVTYTQEDASISELRYHKGALGAVWVSDYDPFGVKPFSNSINHLYHRFFTTDPTVSRIDENGKQRSINDGMGDPTLRYLVGNYPNARTVPHASLFVWDPTLRNYLSNMFWSVRAQAMQAYHQGQKLKAKWEAIRDGAGKVLEIVFLIGGLFVELPFLLPEAISGGVDFIFTLIESAVGVPSDEETEMTLSVMDRMNTYASVLACSDDNEEEVIRIDASYTIDSYKEYYNGPNPTKEEYYFSYNPMTMESAPSPESYFYNSDVIEAYQYGGVFLGAIYPITKEGDFENNVLRKFPASKPDVVTCDVKELEVGGINGNGPQTVPFTLRKGGQYKWASFSAPKTGVYTVSAKGFDSDGNRSGAWIEIFHSLKFGISAAGAITTGADDGTGDGVKFEIAAYVGQKTYIRIYSINKLDAATVNVDVSLKENLTDTIDASSLGVSTKFSRFWRNKDIYYLGGPIASGVMLSGSSKGCISPDGESFVLSPSEGIGGVASLTLELSKPFETIKSRMNLWSESGVLSRVNIGGVPKMQVSVLDVNGDSYVYMESTLIWFFSMSSGRSKSINWAFDVPVVSITFSLSGLSPETEYSDEKVGVELDPITVGYA